MFWAFFNDLFDVVDGAVPLLEHLQVEHVIQDDVTVVSYGEFVVLSRVPAYFGDCSSDCVSQLGILGDAVGRLHF